LGQSLQLCKPVIEVRSGFVKLGYLAKKSMSLDKIRLVWLGKVSKLDKVVLVWSISAVLNLELG